MYWWLTVCHCLLHSGQYYWVCPTWMQFTVTVCTVTTVAFPHALVQVWLTLVFQRARVSEIYVLYSQTKIYDTLDKGNTIFSYSCSSFYRSSLRLCAVTMSTGFSSESFHSLKVHGKYYRDFLKKRLYFVYSCFFTDLVRNLCMIESFIVLWC